MHFRKAALLHAAKVALTKHGHCGDCTRVTTINAATVRDTVPFISGTPLAAPPNTPTGMHAAHHDQGSLVQSNAAGSPRLALQRRLAAAFLPAPVRVASPPPASRRLSFEHFGHFEQLAIGLTAMPVAAGQPPQAHATARSPLRLAAVEHAELAALYGHDTVTDAIAHDCFADVAALRRQLAHEAKTEVTLADYQRIAPFQAASGERSESAIRPASDCNARDKRHERDQGDEPDTCSLEHVTVTHADGVVSQRRRSLDAQGDCIAFEASGRFGVPAGWIAQDVMRRKGNGLMQLRTRLIGPNGESGMVLRSFDGVTLHLDKAYKSTLPTRLAGVPGFDRSVATINYLTARACKLLGVTAQNLQQIKVNRLQHRPVLMHLDWLMRHNPGNGIGELIDRTTWAKSYIRETADIVGRTLVPVPAIDPESSPAWEAAHPGALRRDWSYLQSETERLTFKHLTQQKIDKVDAASGDWRASAAMALARYKAARCQGLAPAEAAGRGHEIDILLQTRLAAIGAEETGLRRRYDLPQDRVPAHLNFDVTYRTIARDA